MYGQIREYVKAYEPIPKNQSRFRPNHSCVSTLAEVVDHIISATDKNKLSLLILLYYSKAFDGISYRQLLAILHYLGFSNNAESLLRSYLPNRTQRVNLQDKLSDKLSIVSGIPQGSILGPLLFTLYISNLSQVLSRCTAHFYADGMQIYYSFSPTKVSQACQLITEDFKQLPEISAKMCLTVNPDKSQMMRLSPGLRHSG
nr:unnamed protein product [Callosobruchus analis]